MADKILKFATADPNSRRRFGGDSVSDQLSSVHTFYLLVGFAVIVQANQLIGDPINCWCPAHFTGTHADYTDSICWTTNTYYLPFSEEIPKEGDSRQKVGYYQWISLILISQGVLFYMPRAIWRMLSKQSGIAVSTITDAALDCQQQKDSDSKDKSIRYMVKHFGKFLLEINRYHHMRTNRCQKCLSVCYGYYLSVCYLFLKLIYLTNVVGQLYLLNVFLDLEYNMYGIYIIQRMVRGEEWRAMDVFPRVTLCDFKIRLLGNVHRYTVQCSLPMNLFNEIIYIFIWFWFVFVAMVTAISVIAWMYVIIYKPHNTKYVTSRLVALDRVALSDSHARRKKIRKFIDNYLRSDGCFMIQLVSMNSSDLIAAEFIAGLWEHYHEHKKRMIKSQTSDGETVFCSEGNLTRCGEENQVSLKDCAI